MPTQTVPIRAPSLVRVEVLDLTALREEAVNHYISLKPERSEWPEDKKKRLIISTTVEWGRVANDKSVFLLNENGGGPTRPLSSTVTANIALFAAMPRHGNDPGFKESTPFTRVKINDVTARELPSKLSVQLEEFIRQRIPEAETFYNRWREILGNSMAKRNAALARQPAASATPEKISHDEGIAPQPSAGGAMEPPKKRNGPRLSM